jgi:Fe-Mn family superoxide dismutase
MRYRLKQIQCRPWTLSGLSLKLIESHYENNYGGALRRRNAITEQLESLDLAKAPAHVVNSLKREELTALNSTLLHSVDTLDYAKRLETVGVPVPQAEAQAKALGDALGKAVAFPGDSITPENNLSLKLATTKTRLETRIRSIAAARRS